MSQDKTQFETGALRDSQEGKEDYVETVSYTAMKRFAQYMTGKKKRYGAGNFKKGIPIESYEQSLMRHIQKYFANKYEGGDCEKEEDHLSAILFNAFGIIHEEEREKTKAAAIKKQLQGIEKDRVLNREGTGQLSGIQGLSQGSADQAPGQTGI